MSVVGRAYVNVRGVTRELEGDVSRGVEGALDRVAAGTGPAGGKALGDKMGDGVKESALGTKIEEAVRSADVDRAGNDLGQAIGDALVRDGAIRRGFGRALEAATPEINETGKKLERTISEKIALGVASGFASAATSPVGLIGLAVPPTLTQGFTLLSAAAAGSVEIVGSLGPAIATAGVTGAAGIGTLLTTIGAVTLAFKLSKDEALALGQSLAPVADDFRDISDEVARELFPALASAGDRVNRALGDELRTGLVATSESLAGITGQFARLSEQEFFQSNISDILDSNARSLQLFGAAGIDAISAVSDLGSSAGPAVERVAKAVRDLADGLADSARAGDAGGGLNAFFDRAVDTTFQWSRIVADLSAGLYEVFSIGSADGTLLDSLEDVTQKFRDWTDSATGQGSIAEWFEQARPVMSATGDVLAALGSTVADLSGDTGSLVNTLDSLADGLPALGDILGTLSGSFQDILAGVIPLIGGLATELTPGVDEAAGAIADNLIPALENVAGPLGDTLEAALGLVDNIAPLAQVVGAVLAPALDIAATGLEGINAALDELPGPIGTTIASIAGLRIAIGLLTRSARFGPMVASTKASYAELRAANAATSASFAGLRAAGSLTASALGGGLGIALGAAAIGYGIFAGKSAEAKAATDALRDSLDEQTGAVTENSRELVKKKLLEDGVLQAAKDVGISVDVVTDAYLGNSDALTAVNDKVSAFRESLAGVPADAAGADPGLATIQLSFTKVQDAISGGNEETKKAREEWGLLNESASEAAGAVDRTGQAFERGEISTGRYLKQVRDLDGGTRAATEALRTMRRVTLSVNDAAIKGIEAQIGFEQAIDDARKKFKETSDTLKIGNQAGRDNVGVLLGIAKAAGEVTGSADKQQKALRRARDEVLELAKSKTKDDDAAKKLTDRIFKLTETYDKVPTDVETDVKSPTIQSQINKAKELQEKLEEIDGRTFSYVIVEGNSDPGGGRAVEDFGGGESPGTVTVDPGRGGGGRGGKQPVDRSPGDPRRGGVNFNGPISINAENYDDMVKKLDRKSRAVSIGGFDSGRED